MNALNSKRISTPYGEKRIAVYAQDICDWTQPLDVMTVSAFYRDYIPLRRTLLGALETKNISVENLARSPEIDLRSLSNIWLSCEIKKALLPIRRVGCIESALARAGSIEWKEHILSSIQSYFRMLDIASINGIPVETIGLPVLGGGNQGVDTSLTAIPTLNECYRFLKTNASTRSISIISKNAWQAEQFAQALETSYSAHADTLESSAVQKKEKRDYRAFISYSSKDKNIADNLCSKLEAQGIGVWYAPRDVDPGDYATSIVKAVKNCTHFIIIISKNSLSSNHVLNEIDLGFKQLDRHVRFYPLKLDNEELEPAFEYYLSRQHWMDARIPPIEKRLEEFVEKIQREAVQ